MILAIDIETYSSADLIAVGVYKYVEAPDFTILLLGYAFDDEPVQVIDLTAQPLPAELEEALTDPNIIKTAFNAQFERTCLARYLQRSMPPEQWHCTQVHAAMLGLPRSLAEVGKVLKLADGKMDAGKQLINFFSKPARNGNRSRNLPQHALDRWELFKTYCMRDVEVERTIRKRLEQFPVPPGEQTLWCLDQEINDRGVLVDQELVAHALSIAEAHNARLMDEATVLTGIHNPNSLMQIKEWLQQEENLEVEKLTKATLPQVLQEVKGDTARRLLEIRHELSRSSNKKYVALHRAANDDGRIRGTMQFYGARTGRWAGRIFQPQNLPQNHLSPLDLARDLVKAGRVEDLLLIFGDIPDTLSQLIRTTLIPAPGCHFIVADFSAIEARVIAWFAQEQWRLEVFRTHGKIYEASASQMFRVPIEQVTKGSPLRQKGKIAELALGYGGAAGALEAMGALRGGLTPEELPGLVRSWREANPKITQFWWDVDSAATVAVRDKIPMTTHGLKFVVEKGFLFIKLPSGRSLAYASPRLAPNRFGRMGVTYQGLEQGRKWWGSVETYGPKLVENIVQATARDLLAYSLLQLAAAGYRPVMHVHDEVILEADTGSLAEVEAIMAQVPEWAAGLPQRADGYECDFYRKE